MKLLIEIFQIIALVSIVILPFLKVKGKGIFTLITISVQIILTSIIAVCVLKGDGIEFLWPGSFITGPIPIRIDSLSAWFILILNFTFLTGALYGLQYMKKYADQAANLTMHAISFILAYTCLVDICILQNSIVFLVVWEIMALSSFILVIFEHYKTETLKAGINFLIQSHVCIMFLTLSFIWVKIQTGSYDMAGITVFASSEPVWAATGLFVFFFIAFGIKSGFVPFHTWLPLAHPAAPAHISGIMSGVIIKIGIYGLLRVILLMKTNFITIGYLILMVSVISGIYGVMLAIVQHNLKKLLAYHSIENIGIIGMGIGLGCLGLGYQNPMMAILGFSGALLHTLNHSLFKSLLFYSAGSVYLATHTMNIDSLGGVIKKMPFTASFFLIGSLAICGLPPLNGFISEFLIYLGFFNGLHGQDFSLTLVMIFSIIGLVIIGGLAIMCFTKAIGIVFLGTPRNTKFQVEEQEHWTRSFAMFPIVVVILAIGTIPLVFIKVALLPASLFLIDIPLGSGQEFITIINIMQSVGWYALLFILFISVLFLIRKWITRNRFNPVEPTWGCGYPGKALKTQYTATSFVKTYSKLFEHILSIEKHKVEAEGMFPKTISHETHVNDKLEKWLIDKPVFKLRGFLSRFAFLQNGNIQFYVLYGFIFVTLIVLIPQFWEKIIALFKFFNRL